MIKFARRAEVSTAFSFLAAFLSVATLALPANATVTGTPISNGWTPAECPPATASFIGLASAERKFGFGGDTLTGGQMISSGVGESGLVLTTPFSSTTGSDDFRLIQISFKDSTIPATSPRVKVTFCFAFNHGSDSPTSIIRILSTLPRVSKASGWTTVSANSRDFGGFDVRNAVLEKVTFSLSKPEGNIVIGKTVIQTGSGSEYKPTSLALEDTTCEYLDNCTLD